MSDVVELMLIVQGGELITGFIATNHEQVTGRVKEGNKPLNFGLVPAPLAQWLPCSDAGPVVMSSPSYRHGTETLTRKRCWDVKVTGIILPTFPFECQQVYRNIGVAVSTQCVYKCGQALYSGCSRVGRSELGGQSLAVSLRDRSELVEQ